MAYSHDLKKRVLEFIRKGGNKAEAARRFDISRPTIYRWLSQPSDYVAGKPGPKGSRKFDREALKKEVEENPHLLLRELAASRGVCINTISVALKRIGISRRKNKK